MIVCPKCKKSGSSITLSEVWNYGLLNFQQHDDGTIDEIGDRIEGSPVKVIAACDCGKNWTLRGITQIIDFERVEQ
jgi:hypothetical protein